MPFSEQAERERELVNQMALVFETGGLPPIAGRIIGRLLLCDPPHQSSGELADYLLASRGAISTMTRTLVGAGLVELVRFPGDRASYFRLVDGCWSATLHAETMRVRRLREIGDQALRYFDDVGASPERAARVRDFREFAVFFEKELPALIQGWDQRSKP